MSSTSIRISEEFAEASRREARALQRSLGGQIEHWAKIGRAIEHSGQFDSTRVARALAGELPVDELNAYERTAYHIAHEEMMREPLPGEAKAYRRKVRDMERAGVEVAQLGD